MIRTAAAVLFTAIAVLLTIAVLNGMKSPDCERLYDEYSNTVNMDLRAEIMHEGYSNGCFHAE